MAFPAPRSKHIDPHPKQHGQVHHSNTTKSIPTSVLAWPKAIGIERAYCILQLPGHSLSLKKVRPGTQKRNWSRDHGKMLLAGFLPVFLRPTCLWLALPTLGWGFPHQPSIKTMSTGQSDREVLQLRFLLYRCVKLTSEASYDAS